MARVAGVECPDSERAVIGLTRIYGVGRKRASHILTATGISPDTRMRDLTEQDLGLLSSYIMDNYMVEGDLRRDVQQNIKRLMDIGSYRGLRHRRGLPVRGQRTRTNSRQRKGPRRTVGRSKKE